MSEVQSVAAEAATPIPVTVTQPEPKTMEMTMGDVFDKMNPHTVVGRDKENGQFKSKEAPAEAAPAEGAEASDTVEPIVQEPAAETKETAPPSIPRPQSWKSEYETAWAKLSPEEQKTFADWEGERHKQFVRLGETAKIAEQYQAVIDKYPGTIDKGQTPAQVIENLLFTKAAFQRDPAGTLIQLANQLGINLSQLVHPAQNDGAPVDPQVAALEQKLSYLQRQLHETTNSITAREQQELQARQNSLQDSIDKFSSDKDYWGDIEGEVLNQIHALRAANPEKVIADPIAALKEAHDRAIKLTPSVQEKLDKAAKEEAAKKKAAEDKKKADDAKRLASLNVKSTVGASPKSSNKPLEEQMEEIYDKIQARG